MSLLESDEERASFSLHMVDVTEPLELQERLQAERDYTRSVIDTASSMIVVTDVDGTIIVANPATHRPHRLHRGRARRTPLLGEADHRGAARAGLADLRRSPAAAARGRGTAAHQGRRAAARRVLRRRLPGRPGLADQLCHLGDRRDRRPGERRHGRAPAAVGPHDRLRRHRPAGPDHPVQHRGRAHARRRHRDWRPVASSSSSSHPRTSSATPRTAAPPSTRSSSTPPTSSRRRRATGPGCRPAGRRSRCP